MPVDAPLSKIAYLMQSLLEQLLPLIVMLFIFGIILGIIQGGLGLFNPDKNEGSYSSKNICLNCKVNYSKKGDYCEDCTTIMDNVL
jgi:tetrahydromethanopterin S-methyltransferase subunit E